MKQILIIFMVLFISSCSSIKINTEEQRTNTNDERRSGVLSYIDTHTYEQARDWENPEILKIRSSFNISIHANFQNYVDEFIFLCEKYNIPGYKEKFAQLKYITTANLPISRTDGVVWGIITRDKHNAIEGIHINWISMHDDNFEKITVFHELAHAILEYKHSCESCCDIMAKYTRENYVLRKNWLTTVDKLFTEAPILKQNRKSQH